MTAQAATQFGCDVVILEKAAEVPAAGVCVKSLVGDWNTPEALLELASQVDILTLENEFVNADALAVVEQAGHLVLPSAGCMRIVQDKLWQKEALAKVGVPLPGFRDTPTQESAVAAGHEFGWPIVLKKRRNGYDGKGNATVRNAAEISEAWDKLGGDTNALFVEAFFPFERELAVMITRSTKGESVTYPVVETVQKDHICHVVKAPAAVDATIARAAAEMAEKSVEAVGGIGTFGVEMFLSRDGEVVVNELAPRVHNSGHYTIEACVCSQFENHVRAVLGWPLGSPEMVAPAAVMINLLGKSKGPGEPKGWTEAVAVAGAHIHVYGKAASAPGRKMGHLTALGASVDAAHATARQAADALQFGD